MALDVIFLTTNQERHKNLFAAHKERFVFAKSLNVENKSDEQIYKEAMAISNTSSFYLVFLDYKITNFDFKFKPESYDEIYVHAWGGQISTGVALINKKMQFNTVTNKLGDGIKYLEDCICMKIPYDIIMISVNNDDTTTQDMFEKHLGFKIKRVNANFKSAAFLKAAEISETDVMYIIEQDSEPTDFMFDYQPPEYDLRYKMIFANKKNRYDKFSYGNVYLASKNVINQCIDATKNIDIIASKPYQIKQDVFFISYDEPNAEKNWHLLKQHVPYAKRIHGIKGIVNAHAKAAELSTTSCFFVVDGDAAVMSSFDFTIDIPEYDWKYVHVWKSRNPVNGLEYGYGGVKYLSKAMFENMQDKIVDMTTILGEGVKYIDDCVSVTIFNSDDVRAFRGAFRECAKLASGCIKNQNDIETKHRLHIWTTRAEGPFASTVLYAAEQGKAFGEDPESDLTLLNDYQWLQLRYNDMVCNLKTEYLSKMYTWPDDLYYLPVEDSWEFADYIWLIDSLHDCVMKPTVLICGGGNGVFAGTMFNNMCIEKCVSIDIEDYENFADAINKNEVADNWKFKAATCDMFTLKYDNVVVKTGGVEHFINPCLMIYMGPSNKLMIQEWVDQIPEGKMVAILTHNKFEPNSKSFNSQYELEQTIKLSYVEKVDTFPREHQHSYLMIGVK